MEPGVAAGSEGAQIERHRHLAAMRLNAPGMQRDLGVRPHHPSPIPTYFTEAGFVLLPAGVLSTAWITWFFSKYTMKFE
jgi:hypothetical protein